MSVFLLFFSLSLILTPKKKKMYSIAIFNQEKLSHLNGFQQHQAFQDWRTRNPVRKKARKMVAINWKCSHLWKIETQWKWSTSFQSIWWSEQIPEAYKSKVSLTNYVWRWNVTSYLHSALHKKPLETLAPSATYQKINVQTSFFEHKQ